MPPDWLNLPEMWQHVDTNAAHTVEFVQVLSNASIQGMMDLFPDPFSGAIQRIATGVGLATAITMSFPRTSLGNASCMMTFALESHTVEHLAWILYRARVETQGQCREVILSGGARISPQPSLVLECAQIHILVEVFGPVVTQAIMASHVYKAEITRGTRTTRCVSMTIPGRIDGSKDAQPSITLVLGLDEADAISGKLYV